MAAHSRILAWNIPWTEGHGGLQSMRSQKVGQNLATEALCKPACSAAVFASAVHAIIQ